MSGDLSTERVPSVLSTGVIVVSVVFLVLASLAVALRFKARRLAKQSFQADDWWIIIALVASFALSINSWVFSAVVGVDYYKINVATGAQKSVWFSVISGCIFTAAVTIVKISILLFYKRIFSTWGFAIATWIGVAVVSVWGIILLAMTITLGDPVSWAWTGVGHLRWNVNTLGTAQIISSIILDAMVLVFPLPMIYNLRMPTRKKLQVGAIFWLGAFCFIAAVARLVIFRRTVQAELHPVGYEGTSLLSKTGIFQLLEINCSIIAGCLPCYAPLVPKTKSLLASMRNVGLRKSNNTNASHEKWSQTPSSSADNLEANRFDATKTSRSWEITWAETHCADDETNREVHSSAEDVQSSKILVTQAVNVERV